MLDPGAELRLLPENRTQKRITPRILVYHTIVGSAESAYGYFLRSTGLESTWIVPKQGRRWQLMDTNVRADCNYRANDWALSVETGDNGAPETDPWTDSQLRELIDLGRWALAVHPTIRRVLCTAWDGTGWGWHAMWGAPSQWTPSAGKTCPGRTRIAQLHRIVFPALAGSAPRPTPPPLPQETFMALSDAEQDELLKQARAANMHAAAALNEAKAAHEDAKHARSGALVAIAEVRELRKLVEAREG